MRKNKVASYIIHHTVGVRRPKEKERINSAFIFLLNYPDLQVEYNFANNIQSNVSKSKTKLKIANLF